MNRLFLPRWRRNVALVALLGIACMMVPAAHAEDSAKKLFKKGQEAEQREDFQAAFEFYHRAWLRSPSDVRYKASYERIKPEAAFVHLKQGRQLRESGDYTGAITEFLRALDIDPSLEVAQQEIRLTRQKMAEANPKGEIVTPKMSADEMMLDTAQAPVSLKPISNEPLTIHANEDSKVVYQTICKQAGLNVLFDSEYTSKRIQVDLTNTTLYDALRIVGAISGTFWKPITPNTIFVAADTRAKRTALEQMAVRTFFLTNPSSQQDLNDIQTALRNVMGEGPKFFSVPSQNAILGRGTPDQLLLAEKIIDDLDKARPEVVLDVAILEVDRDLLRNIGIQLPGSFGLTLQASTASSTSSTTGSTSTTSPTLNDLGSLNATNFAVTVGTATANLLLTDSDTRILQSPRIRASDGQKATLKIGSRIPVATGSYSTGAATTTVSALVNTQFQYLDIGTNVEVTPTIHFDRDVTLKIKIEVLSENGNVTISGVTEPIIGQRSIEHTIRLKEGEVNILGGILEKNDLSTVGGTPGVGEIPILKYLFSSQQHEVQTYEVVFMLIPHVVRAHTLTPLNTRMIDTGTGNTIELRYSGDAAAPTPAADDVAPANPTMAAPTATVPAAAVTPASQVPTVNLGGQPIAADNGTGSTANAMGMPPAPASLAGHAMPVPPPPPGSAGAMAALPPVFMNVVVPSTPERVGSTFQTSIELNGGTDVYSVPLELHYDADKLTLINVDGSDLLGNDGQTISLVHRDDGKGTVVINASRPPGVKGVNGNGAVCVATFVAKAPGDATVSIAKAQPRNSAQQTIPANAGQAVVHIQ
jgi:general secretion pathway protein D